MFCLKYPTQYRAIFMIMFLVVVIPSTASSERIKLDLRGGWGDFEYSPAVHWQRVELESWPFGVEDPGPGNEVACGWTRLTDYGIKPGVHTVYDIEEGMGVNGSNRQYFALQNLDKEQHWTALMCSTGVDDTQTLELHHGDEVTFRIDHINMSDFDNLPSGSSVTYKLRIKTGNSKWAEKVLTPSREPFAAEVTATVDQGISTLNYYIWLETSGNLGGRKPGIVVDNAHIYVKRPGNPGYLTEEIPVTGDRNIKTVIVNYPQFGVPIRNVAAEYDKVIIQAEAYYFYVPRLKYLNPGVKVYLYESGGWITDSRDSKTLIDSTFSNSPIPFGWAMKTKPAGDTKTYIQRWLYPLESSDDLVANDPRGASKRLPYVFSVPYPWAYYVRVQDTEYQRLWADYTINKAKRFRVDGIFIDTLGAELVRSKNGAVLVDTKPNHIQNFIHAVFPRIRQAGLEVIQNQCSKSYTTYPGKIYFDPWWKPEGGYAAPEYSANTADTTADTFFQEWAFFPNWPENEVPINRYSLAYWLTSLKDMDMPLEWNKKLPANQAKRIQMNVTGFDRAADPMKGIDGWGYFTLCSYLLGQNDYTDYCMGLGKDMGIDLAAANKLGNPVAARSVLNPDESLQVRDYEKGIVVVNGHTTANRQYTVNEDLVDLDGNRILKGTQITLKPHTGRILLQSGSAVVIGLVVANQGAAPGDVVALTVEFNNPGVVDATNVTIRASIPPEMDYIKGSAEQSGGTWHPEDKTVSWVVGSIPAGQGGKRTFLARVK